MSWNGTAMTLTWMPVAASKSGARRMRGSATCGPLKVSRFTVVPGGMAGALGGALGDCAPAGTTVAATSSPTLAVIASMVVRDRALAM